jgi:rRNA-processing protein FCF1
MLEVDLVLAWISENFNFSINMEDDVRTFLRFKCQPLISRVILEDFRQLKMTQPNYSVFQRIRSHLQRTSS